MKTKLLLCVLFLITLQSVIYSQNLSSQFAGYSFDNGSLNNTFDPGNGNLTKTGSNATIVAGKDGFANNAISLNGDDLSGSPFNNQPSVPDFSWSFWINTTNNNQTRTIWRNYDGFSNEVNVNMLSSGEIQTQVQIGGLSATNYTSEIDTPNFILDGNWHHIVVVLQKYLIAGNQGRLRVRTYIDGAEEPGLYMDGINYGAIWQAGHVVSVYNYNDGLDEVNFYKDDLTPQDIADLYSQDICVPTNIQALSKTDLSLNLEWSADASVTEWDIAVVEYDQPFNGNATTSGLITTSFMASGLQPETEYNIFIRGVCNGVPSRWRRAIISTEKSSILVDATATGNNDGTSWADAYTNLNTALQNHPESEFWIKSGTYKAGSSGRTTKFNIGLNQKLYGGFNGTEITLSQRDLTNSPTVLSGDFNDDDDNTTLTYTNTTKSENAYNVATVTGAFVVLDGLTFSGGNANGSTTADREGSGLIIQTTTLVKNCIFEFNINTRGGALSIANGANGQIVRIENNVFRNNLAAFAAAFYSPTGRAGTFEFVNNLFYQNETKPSPAGNGLSGVIWFRSANNNFSDNFTFINNTFSDNTYDVQNVNCNVRTNHIGNIRSKFYNNIFWNNTNNSFRAFHAGGGSFFEIDIKNNLDENNFSNISNNIVTSVANTITSNPDFVDVSNANYRLLPTSPAIDYGDNAYLPNDIFNDLSNNLRVFNTNVDLGAFEFNPSLSIDKNGIESKTMHLYPNPASHILNIADTNFDIEYVEIFDILGKSVLSTSDTSIDVSNLKSGIYILKSTTNTNVISKRFVKN